MRAIVSICATFVFFAVTQISCVSTENRWTDNIELSAKEAIFSSQTDSIEISTEGTQWWINDINADGRYIYSDSSEVVKDYVRFDGDWFTVEKQGKQKLIVKVSENKSKNSRKMVITVEAGNYFEYINVLQKGCN